VIAWAPLAAQQAPADNAAPASVAAPVAASSAAGQNGAADFIVVPAGTKLPLVLHNAISTRNAHSGDPVYLETIFPIVQDDKILVPAGSYVQGEVTEAHRPGRVKGTGEMRIRLTTMILPNGYTVRFDAIPANAGTGGNETTGKEGEIKGDTNKASDAGTVIKTTGAGAGIGGIASRSGTGAGIGAGAGAAAGVAAVLLSRGPELELPRGTTLDAVLDRPLSLDASKINFSEPGRASNMSGPPNRQPVRNSSPF
jgi:type IV secretion system protein VirB10